QLLDMAAVSVSSGTFNVEYSTLGTVGGGSNSSALRCPNGGAGSSIRNSIALTYSAAAEISCPNVAAEGVFLEASANEPFNDMSNWFVNFPAGDFHIAPNAPAEFTDPLSTFATWTN